MKDFMKDYGVVMLRTTELVVTIVVFIFIGKYLDQKFDWHQKGLITLTLVGSVLAFVRFVYKLQQFNSQPPSS